MPATAPPRSPRAIATSRRLPHDFGVFWFGDAVSLVGRQLTNVPRHSANLLLVQSFKLGGNAATAGAGLNYVGEREGSVAPVDPSTSSNCRPTRRSS